MLNVPTTSAAQDGLIAKNAKSAEPLPIGKCQDSGVRIQVAERRQGRGMKGRGIFPLPIIPLPNLSLCSVCSLRLIRHLSLTLSPIVAERECAERVVPELNVEC